METRTNKNKVAIISLIIVLTALSYRIFFHGASVDSNVHKGTEFIMDTICNITVIADSKVQAEMAIEDSFKELRRLEGLLSKYKPDSEVSRLNEVKLSLDTYILLKTALEISKLTNGAFDPTVEPVVSLWDFEKKLMPAKEDIEEKLRLVGFTNIELEDMSAKFLQPGMSIDLGGIAKGYATDRVIEILKAHGVKAGLSAVAGDIRVFGNNNNRPWRVGIKAPRGEGIVGVLNLTNMAVSTSGDYERFFIKDGVRYHHLINPATGYPVNDFQSVTIVSKKGVVSDSFATAVFVMGKEKGLKFIIEHGLQAFVVFKDGSTFITDNLLDYFESKNNN